MKTSSIINRIATIAGLSLGAFALSVAAQTWTAPTQSAPDGNVAAPINVSGTSQSKLGSLTVGLSPLNAVIGGLSVGNFAAFGTFTYKPTPTVVAGSVLTSDANGTATWQAPGTASVAPTCRLIAATATSLGWQTVPTPAECIDNTCSLALAVFHYTLGTVNTLKSTMLTQFSGTFPFGASGPNWWVKPGSSNDGTNCTVGKNGTTDGCDSIMNFADEIILYDDHASGESISGQWSLRDTSSNYWANLYVCK